MSRYFFHSQDGDTELDTEGTELPSLRVARDEAIRTCGEILRGFPRAIENGGMFRLWVTDKPHGEGNTLFTVTVAAQNP
jgi:hypothetical protein